MLEELNFYWKVTNLDLFIAWAKIGLSWIIDLNEVSRITTFQGENRKICLL
jgi:hypothetical protein